MKIAACKTNHLTNPMGFHMDKPVFSWKIREAKGKRQKNARIKVSKASDMNTLVYDSGIVSDLNSVAAEIEIALEPRTRYYWTVEVTSDANEYSVSGINYFETAKMDEPWIGRWITAERGNSHPVFEKTVVVEKPVKMARLYLSGLGLYEASIDGKK